MTVEPLIRHLEELAANAWPAAVVQQVDGWRLRFNWGVSGRANSVWPNAAGDYTSLHEKLATVEAFYARWGVPARYQICPAVQPAHLDGVLAERGYECEKPTQVQIAEVATVLQRTTLKSDLRVTIHDRFDKAWYAAYCEAEQVSGHVALTRRGILQRIGPRCGFSQIEVDRQIVAVGVGVLERQWLGIFNLATHPDFRRQHAATAALHALAQWGQDLGATCIYLQVMENNQAARPLYERSGFTWLYTYCYRTAPERWYA